VAGREHLGVRAAKLGIGLDVAMLGLEAERVEEWRQLLLPYRLYHLVRRQHELASRNRLRPPAAAAIGLAECGPHAADAGDATVLADHLERLRHEPDVDAFVLDEA